MYAAFSICTHLLQYALIFCCYRRPNFTPSANLTPLKCVCREREKERSFDFPWYNFFAIIMIIIFSCFFKWLRLSTWSWLKYLNIDFVAVFVIFPFEVWACRPGPFEHCLNMNQSSVKCHFDCCLMWMEWTYFENVAQTTSTRFASSCNLLCHLMTNTRKMELKLEWNINNDNLFTWHFDLRWILFETPMFICDWNPLISLLGKTCGRGCGRSSNSS